MNIFVTDNDPIECAKALDDKRAVKMILETTQILCTVIRVKNEQYAEFHSLYKKTHQNHPCVLWAGATVQNYRWTCFHLKALLEEYTFRFNKNHKSGNLFNILVDFNLDQMPNDVSNVEFENCTSFKDEPDAISAYKMTLNEKWRQDKRNPKWTKRLAPVWKN